MQIIPPKTWSREQEEALKVFMKDEDFSKLKKPKASERVLYWIIGFIILFILGMAVLILTYGKT